VLPRFGGGSAAARSLINMPVPALMRGCTGLGDSVPATAPVEVVGVAEIASAL
jgi:hypothetical protein